MSTLLTGPVLRKRNKVEPLKLMYSKVRLMGIFLMAVDDKTSSKQFTSVYHYVEWKEEKDEDQNSLRIPLCLVRQLMPIYLQNLLSIHSSLYVCVCVYMDLHV